MQPQQEVVLKRSTRVKRSAIPDDYIVYALEHESDLSMDNDPVSLKKLWKVIILKSSITP